MHFAGSKAHVNVRFPCRPSNNNWDTDATAPLSFNCRVRLKSHDLFLVVSQYCNATSDRDFCMICGAKSCNFYIQDNDQSMDYGPVISSL